MMGNNSSVLISIGSMVCARLVGIIDRLRLQGLLDELSLFLYMHRIETSGGGSRWCPSNILYVFHRPSTKRPHGSA